MRQEHRLQSATGACVICAAACILVVADAALIVSNSVLNKILEKEPKTIAVIVQLGFAWASLLQAFGYCCRSSLLYFRWTWKALAGMGSFILR